MARKPRPFKPNRYDRAVTPSAELVIEAIRDQPTVQALIATAIDFARESTGLPSDSPRSRQLAGLIDRALNGAADVLLKVHPDVADVITRESLLRLLTNIAAYQIDPNVARGYQLPWSVKKLDPTDATTVTRDANGLHIEGLDQAGAEERQRVFAALDDQERIRRGERIDDRGRKRRDPDESAATLLHAARELLQAGEKISIRTLAEQIPCNPRTVSEMLVSAEWHLPDLKRRAYGF